VKKYKVGTYLGMTVNYVEFTASRSAMHGSACPASKVVQGNSLKQHGGPAEFTGNSGALL